MVLSACSKFWLAKVVVTDVSRPIDFADQLYGWNLVVTVEDCLSVLLNLLKNNPSNQNYFREGSYIRRLVDFFELGSIGEKRWSAQKVTNVHLLLQVTHQFSSFIHLLSHRNLPYRRSSRRFEFWFRQLTLIRIRPPVNVQWANAVRRTFGTIDLFKFLSQVSCIVFVWCLP